MIYMLINVATIHCILLHFIYSLLLSPSPYCAAVARYSLLKKEITCDAATDCHYISSTANVVRGG